MALSFTVFISPRIFVLKAICIFIFECSSLIIFNISVFFKIPGGKPSQCCHKLPPKAHLIDSANLLEDSPPQEGQNQISGPNRQVGPRGMIWRD